MPDKAETDADAPGASVMGPAPDPFGASATRSPAAEELADGVLAVAERLAAAPLVVPSPEFRSVARTRMLNLIAVREQRPAASRPAVRLLCPSGALGALLRLGLALLVIAAFVSGVAVASASALPGDFGYPAKLALEDVRVALAFGERQRAEVYLDIADHRVSELVASASLPGARSVDELVGGYEQAVGVALGAAQAVAGDAQWQAQVEERLRVQEARLSEALSARNELSEEMRAALGRALGLSATWREEWRAQDRHEMQGAGGPAPATTPARSDQGVGYGITPTMTIAPLRPDGGPSVTPAPGERLGQGEPQGATPSPDGWQWSGQGQPKASPTATPVPPGTPGPSSTASPVPTTVGNGAGAGQAGPNAAPGPQGPGPSPQQTAGPDQPQPPPPGPGHPGE